MRTTLNTLGALLLLFVIVSGLAGCGSSGSTESGNWWGGGDSGGTTTAPQVQTLTNLNNPGQPIRQGDWTQINGTGFGNTQGAGYVLYTLENGATGNADQYSQWTDTQITCRVPVTIPMGIRGKATWGAQVFTDSGGSSNNLPTNGNPTPNPTPTDVPPSPTPTPTQSASPTPSTSPAVSPTPNPTQTSGGGGGGGGGGTTAQWWDIGFSYATSASNVQVGADIDGNVYVSFEDGGNVFITENDGVGAKASRTIGGNFTSVGSFTGRNHTLFVPQDASKTFGVVYQNATALTVQKGVKSGSTWGFGNFTTVGGSTPAGLNSPTLYLSGSNAYTSYGYSEGGSHKVGVTNCTMPSTGGTTYTTWASTPPMGSVVGRNATISKGTNLNMGYYNGNTYNIGSYNGSGWTNYTSSGISVGSTDPRNAQTTTNGTTPFALFYKSGGEPTGWNLWYYDSSYGYIIPSGNPSTITSSSSNTCGKPVVASGKKTVAYWDSTTSTIFVKQNSDCSGPWSSLGSFSATGSSFGVGSTVNGAPIVSYQSQNAGYNGIRTQVYSSTTPKVVAQREFMRATMLCCYMGVKLPMPRL